MIELKPGQEEGVLFLLKKGKCLLADKMGLGKTVMAIEAIIRAKIKIGIIICPATLKVQWRKSFEKFHPNKNLKIQIINTKKDIIKEGFNFIIINYELLSAHIERLRDFYYAVCICDESHYLKGKDSQRTNLILGPKGIIHNAYLKWLVSATPAHNRPIALWPVFHYLFPHLIKKYNTYEKFAYKYCGAYQTVFGLSFGTPSKKNQEELKELLSEFMLRRDPPNDGQTRRLIPIVSTNSIEKILEDYDRRLTELNSAELKEYVQLAIRNGTWQELAKAKIKQSVEYIEQIMEETEKLVIFTYHQEISRLLKQQLKKFKAEMFIGSTSKKERDIAQDNFINKDSRILIGNIQAIGYGVDGLQKVCNRCLFVQTTENPDDIDSAIGRLDRTGQAEHVLAEFLFIENSLEEEMYNKLIAKKEVTERVLNVR